MGIPRALGLASDAMTGLAVARSLAALADSPAAYDTPAPGRRAGAAGRRRAGGVRLSRRRPAAGGGRDKRAHWTTPLRRHELSQDDDHSWVWVLHWPDPPAGTPRALEAQRAAQLLAAAPHLGDETGRIVADELWPALERDDLEGFGAALMAFQHLNREAFAAAGTPAIERARHRKRAGGAARQRRGGLGRERGWAGAVWAHPQRAGQPGAAAKRGEPPGLRRRHRDGGHLRQRGRAGYREP